MTPYREQLEALLSQQLAPLRARFDALQRREQQMVALCGVVVLLALVYLLVWQPPLHARNHEAVALQSARDLAQRLEQIGAEAQRSGAQGLSQPVGRDVSLLSAVDKASKDGTLGKPPARMQPDGDNQVRVWFEEQQFDPLLRWMYALQTRYGMRIDNVAIEHRPTAGVVNARLSVVRSP
jgi:general secretion pathway protein M